MRPAAILQHFIAPFLQMMHAARFTAIKCAVEAIMEGGSALPADVGRRISKDSTPKHGIKRMCRLTGNKHLHKELPLVYEALAKNLLGPRPVLLVDWTQLNGRKQQALVAAVAHDGRALPIYQEVHLVQKSKMAGIEIDFLEALAEILPEGCKPIIVTDAGFKNPWFKKVQSLGWDFLGRLGQSVLIQKEGQEEWAKLSEIVNKEEHAAEDIGNVVVAKGNPLLGRMVTVKHAPKGRKGQKKGNRKGCGRSSNSTKKCRARAKRPCAVFTSLMDAKATYVERLYATRMQIEETFRSAKSHRFGWSLEDVRSKSTKRLEVLLMLTALGIFAQVLLGTIIERLGLHRGFQANTIRKRRVNSLFTLGRFAMQTPQLLKKLGGVAWMEFSISRAYGFGESPPQVRNPS